MSNLQRSPQKGIPFISSAHHSESGTLFTCRANMLCATRRVYSTSAVWIGASLFSFGFVFFRITDWAFCKEPKISWLQLTTWTHLMVCIVFLVLGFVRSEKWYSMISDNVVPALGYLAMFVMVMRAMHLNYKLDSFLQVFRDVITHLVVPLVVIGWLASPAGSVPGDKNAAWRIQSIMLFLGVVAFWFFVNVIFRVLRKRWVYGPKAGDPWFSAGRFQMLIGILIAIMSIALIQGVVVQPCAM